MEQSALERLADAAARIATLAEQQLKADGDERLRQRWGGPRVPRFGLQTLLTAIPGLAEHFQKEVPGDYVARTEEGTWEIACPCGENPAVGPVALLECQCGRWFLHDGRKVHVYKPEPEPVAA